MKEIILIVGEVEFKLNDEMPESEKDFIHQKAMKEQARRTGGIQNGQ